MQKVLAIVGPTAIGKTSLAITLAKQLSGEIVSGDSMQVYREVAIGTAKATPQEQKQVKHYLVDTRSIFEPYSVKDFVDQAEAAIQQIGQQEKLPMLVGGTGFYVNALLNQLQLGEKSGHNSAIDNKWQAYLLANGEQKLWQELNMRDSEAASKIAPQNSRRVLRALTVIERTGQQFSKQQTEIKPRYDYLIIGLNSERSEIYRRIDLRVDQMMDQGMLKEAEFVYQNRQREYQILQAIGYKEFFPYFEGEKSLADCVTQLKTASRHYAKRQLTYFRHQLPLTFFDPLNDPDCIKKILEKVEEWLNE
ncbi:tRNA (adenosine(37)-N6)-dimethylallyltransferase MiaA [Lactobacillus sp. ESL0681]|uniref:tRNA (adenosine(37)-N6)-dimethylallyltransferase MiaA n=1 Tax=Lactobacillus sp. ESL0681 TaxID=2983211 RepID=UPI0023F948E4|nr:tRNA (adenosine(37)-N6)-dimethylallyltransferase MiaA [Lactobacillus sp. ESL0681]WEV40909.1 tRNA (adenosine(37)-N6)-dimethylallyltransferase MiaA [Lactobacillus sp. ESL0681]